MKVVKMYLDNEKYVCFEFENGHVYDFELASLKRNPGGWIYQIREKVWFMPEQEEFLRKLSGFTGGEDEIKPGNLS